MRYQPKPFPEIPMLADKIEAALRGPQSPERERLRTLWRGKGEVSQAEILEALSAVRSQEESR